MTTTAWSITVIWRFIFTRINSDVKSRPIVSIPLLLSLWFSPKISAQEEKVSVGLQRLCTEQIKGQLWFNPLRKGLYLCDGTMWIAVLEGGNQFLNFYSWESLCFAYSEIILSFLSDHKRLDYLLEHQVLTTSSETHDIEVSIHFLMWRIHCERIWSWYLIMF